jgi:hypothetical protein
MHNGLVVSFFITTCFLAAVALWRASRGTHVFPSATIVGYLGILVVLCKSAGVLVYSAVIGPVALWARPRIQVSIATILVSVALFYPAVRFKGVFPTASLVEIVSSINAERASSLQTRFDQEDQLLARASERAWFGWGRFGRSRVYDENGKDISLTDGFWIITFGQYGIVGFIALFGLLTLPVYRARILFRNLSHQRERLLWAMLVLILSLTTVEQLPNAALSPWGWLIAGTLLGQSEYLLEAK